MCDCKVKPGDVVRLKSGGPRMTVASVHGDQADCVWFTRLDSSQPCITLYESLADKMTFIIESLEHERGL